MNFQCGHQVNDTTGFGRGAARAKRLAEYAGRKCFDCAAAGLRARASELTVPAGVNEAEYHAGVAERWTARIRNTYTPADLRAKI